MSFTHLHLHTEYSLLDGACRIPKLVERIKALGMTSCAITDHGVMYGCIDFYSAMKDAGIKPIIGCEVYVCRDRLDKSAANREYSHLILLCENNTGYQNLMKLVSEGFLTGYYYRPRIDYNLIRQHSEGLICLSACLSCCCKGATTMRKRMCAKCRIFSARRTSMLKSWITASARRKSSCRA